MAITSVPATKTYLGLTSTDEDAALGLLLAGVEAALVRLIGYDPSPENGVVEYHSGDFRQAIVLRRIPVRAVTEVRLDQNGYYGQGVDAFGATTILTPGADYYLKLDGPNSAYTESGLLYRVGRDWPGRSQREYGLLAGQYVSGGGNIKVTMNVGFPTVGEDLKLAVWQSVAQQRAGRQYGMPFNSESFDGYSYSLANGGSLEEQMMRIGSVAQVIGTYRKPRVG